MLRKILGSGLRKEIKTKPLGTHHLGQVFFLIVFIVQQTFCTFPSQQEKLTYKGWENEEQRERKPSCTTGSRRAGRSESGLVSVCVCVCVEKGQGREREI